MNCDRCEYKIGIFSTRCKICGERGSRIRIGVVATTCMFAGVAVGCLLINFLKL
jgi:hypothetical protein